MKPIVVHGDQATGKTFNEKAFARHYGAEVGGEVQPQWKAGLLKSGHLYTSLRPVEGARNIHIDQALQDAGIKPFNPAQ